jgi:hypothetical protein
MVRPAGKGSTVTVLSSVLAAAGYRTGAYTSPHLLRLEERIALGGGGLGAAADGPLLRPVRAADLSALVLQHAGAIRQRVEAEAADGGGALSHFEVMTALALRCEWRTRGGVRPEQPRRPRDSRPARTEPRAAGPWDPARRSSV